MTAAPALRMPGARVLLVGAASHVDGSPLSSVAAVRRSVAALRQVLVERCGVAEDAVEVLHDPAHPQELGSAITAAANAAQSVLLVYYVGHGLVSPSTGELHLATHATDDLVEGLAYKALPYAAVREALTRCRAHSIVVVLDCCFSGRAEGAYGSAAADAFAATAVRGTHVLTSAARDEAALALPNEEHTAFTGRLIRLLTAGDPTRGAWLSLLDAYDWLDRRLPADGLPRPRQHVSDTSGRLLLAPNPAFAAGTPPVPVAAAPPADVPCPYRGMERYGPQDARYFFGRDSAIAELTVRLADPSRHGPLVVIGPSGSGKSSLLHAGLLPALESDAVPRSARWTTRVFTPGEQPLANLEAHQAPAGAWTVLVVDQFEELFTAGADEDAQAAFIRALCALATAGTHVVLGVRADFYGQCMAHPELVSALRDNAFLAAPMSDVDLRTVIEQPARVAGLELEAGLVDLVLRDLRAGHAEFDAGGQLPFLSYALLATWQRRSGITLTLAGYQASGGIWEAVSKQAEATFGALDQEAQRVARRTLLRMVRIGTSTEPTRRRVPHTELITGNESDMDRARTVLDVFARDRMITVDEEVASISHESLLRAWPRLRQWIERDSADLVVHQQISDAAEQWARLDRDDGGLYRGRALTEADLWRESRDNERELSTLEREFLDTSSARHRARQAAAERERLRQRRQNRRLRLLTAGLAVVAVIAVVASLLAGQQARTALEQRAAAQEQQRLATARLLVSQAEAARAGNPRLALQLGIAAGRIHPDAQTRASLVDTLAATSYSGTLTGFGDSVRAVAVSPTGGLLATASTARTTNAPASDSAGVAYGAGATSTSDGVAAKLPMRPEGRVTLWTLPPAGLPRRVAADIRIDAYSVRFVAFAPDGRSMLTPGDDEARMTVWDTSDPAHPARRAALDAGAGVDLAAVVYSPDGRTLAAAGGHTITLWDLSDPDHPKRSGTADTGSLTDVDSVSFAPDGHVLAAGGDDGTLLWDVSDPARPRQLGAPLNARSPVAFAPHRAILAVHDKDPRSKNQNAFVLWDVSDPARPVRVGAPMSGNNAAIAMSPTGDLAAVAGFDGTTTVWNIADPAAPARTGPTLAGHTDFVLSVAFAPDGNTVVTGSQDQTVMVWRLAVPGRPRQVAAPLGNVDSIAFRPGAAPLVSGGSHGVVTVRELTDPSHPTELTHAISGDYAELSPDGSALAVGANGQTTLWDVSDPAHPVRGVALPDSGEPAFFSPNGALLITGDTDKSVLWDVSDRSHPVPRVKDLPAIIVLVAGFAADSRTLAVSNIYDFDGKVTLWDVANPAKPVKHAAAVLAGDSTNVTSVSFSPDGQTLATGRADGRIILWDLSGGGAPGRLGQPLAGPPDPNGAGSSLDSSVSVLAMAFSPNGRLLVSTNLTQTMNLWDVTDRTAAVGLGPTVPIPAKAGPDARFSADGATFATLGFDSTAVLWDLTAVLDLQDHALDRACAITGTGLDPAAWSRFVPGIAYQATCP